MTKEEFIDWLAARVSRQERLTMSACAGLAVAGLAAFMVTGGLLFLIMWSLYGGVTLPFMLLSMLYGISTVYVLFTVGQHLSEQEHEAEWNGEVTEFRLATPVSHYWTYSMGSMDTEQSIPERILNIALMPPRFFWSVVQTWKRIEDLKQVNNEACGRVLRLAVKKSEMVPASLILEKLGREYDMPKLFRDLSMINDVIFLTHSAVGVSLTQGFRDDLDKAC